MNIQCNLHSVTSLSLKKKKRKEEAIASAMEINPESK